MQNQVQVVKVDINFLNEIKNYLETKPFNEVHHILNPLLGYNKIQNTTSDVEEIEENNLDTTTPEGFSVEGTTEQ